MIDPFMDVHLHQAPEMLAMSGRYISCGSARQTTGDKLSFDRAPDWVAKHFYPNFLMKNIQLMGNCLGGREDLEKAFLWWKKGFMKPVVDSSFGAIGAAEFLKRTFLDTDRLGKVVCVFE
jgi:D-arabinose 1-dehydrogenase-like Zn-dependent alcohol dehydrogenase